MDQATSRTPAFSICVYCASRSGHDPVFAWVAREVGHWIGAQGGQLVYGGGRAGLMGEVADATLAAGGPVVGVIPRALVELEHAHRGCTELLEVETMAERKRAMASRADAFLALPGGIGTMEELFEMWSWQQLGYHAKPVALLNTAGYYDSLLAFLRQAQDAGLMSEAQWRALHVHTEPVALLSALVQQILQAAPAA